MKRPTFTITDMSGTEGQKRLDHYNKWLLDPKREAGTVYPGYPADKKAALSRKKGKMMEAVVETVVETKPVAKAPKVTAPKAEKTVRTGTKLSKATEVVKATGKDDKEACLKAIVEALSVTRGNASIYYTKALALLG